MELQARLNNIESLDIRLSRAKICLSLISLDIASWLKIKYPNVDHVYAIDNKKGLAYEYKMAIKRNSVEGNVVFKDMLETEGLLIV